MFYTYTYIYVHTCTYIHTHIYTVDIQWTCGGDRMHANKIYCGYFIKHDY